MNPRITLYIRYRRAGLSVREAAAATEIAMLKARDLETLPEVQQAIRFPYIRGLSA